MIEIGQKLWYVPNRRGEPCEVAVSKLGRKWITVGEDWRKMRVDRATMEANDRAPVDGGEYSSPGTCYVSREEYESTVELGKAWSKLRNTNAIRYGGCPAGVSVADIEMAMQLLKLS